MGWGQGIGIGWPNASASVGPTNVYYLIDGWCSESEFPTNTYTTQLVDPNIYHAGEFVYSTVLNTGVLLGSPQSTPLEEVGIIGPVSYECPVTALESYIIIDCITGQDYTSGYYDVGNFALGDRVYTQYGNYGWVQNITTAQEGDQSDGFPIGYVADRCNDCNVNLSATITKEDVSVFNINLFGEEALGDVNFQSSINQLYVNVNYYAVLGNDEDPNIIHSGSYLFEVNSYNVPSGGNPTLIAYDFIFNAPESYSIIEQTVQITSINFDDIALGPYDTGWDVPNKYVTNYGNVWTMYYA